jgi:hypothetical protein
MLRGATVVTGTGAAGLGGWWLYTEAMKIQRKQRKAELPPVDAALQPNQSLSCRLRSRETLTHDTARYRYARATNCYLVHSPRSSICSSLLKAEKNFPCTLMALVPPGRPTLPPFTRARFELPTPHHVLGLSACSHLLAVNDAMVSRAYTPVTLDAVRSGATKHITHHGVKLAGPRPLSVRTF